MLVPMVTGKDQNYHGDAKWIPESIMKKLGPVTYSVDIGNGRTVKRHIDQLRQSIHHSPKSTSNAIDDYDYYEPGTAGQDVDPAPRTPPRPLEEEGPAPRTPPRPLEKEHRYPQRHHRPPERFIHENYP